MKQSALTVGNDLRTPLRRPALIAAVVMGVLADQMVRVPGRPGLNFTLWALAGVGVLIFLLDRRSTPASGESLWLIGGALAFAIALILRDADALAGFSLIAATAMLLLAAGRATCAWVSRAQISEIAFAVLRVALISAGGPLGWGRSVPDPSLTKSEWSRGATTLIRGTLMAVPALLVVTALLMSADPVFENIVRNLFAFDLGPIVEHFLCAALIAWFVSGYLCSLLIQDEFLRDWKVVQPSFAAAEVSVALWILNLLFIGFMLVQLRYLFGGTAIVTATAGLSYAEYARNGFFELVTTVLFVVPVLLIADWAARPETPKARTVLRTAMLVLVLLLVGVIVSAGFRMRLYTDAYGLTELRLYVSVVILWLTVVLGWLAATVLRGQRDRFAFGTFIAAIGCLVLLYLVNPHAIIARVNLERAASGTVYDPAYLTTLSADAVPTLLGRLAILPEEERCRVGRLLEEKWSGERPGGWLAWNLSDARARRLIKARRGTLGCAAE